jgi:hypothetical protein
MKANASRLLATLVLVSAVTGASAEYRCNPAPTFIDQRACEAAKEGPDALRHFVQRMQSIVNLSFHDYVNRETVLAWEAKEEQERAIAKREKSAPAPVATAR